MRRPQPSLPAQIAEDRLLKVLSQTRRLVFACAYDGFDSKRGGSVAGRRGVLSASSPLSERSRPP